MQSFWQAAKWPMSPVASTAPAAEWLSPAKTGELLNRFKAVAAGANGHGLALADLALKHAEQLSRAHPGAFASGAGEAMAGLANPGVLDSFNAYLRDTLQRQVMFLDVLRERGNSYVERERDGFKPVLVFDYDMILDGRSFERRVNYALVRILPPEGYPEQQPDARPFLIIDPRAGHGSGIGGYKTDSEVGVALRDGHPVYFVIFFPDPEPGQKLSDVCAAEAVFLREVQNLHPDSPKPLVIGNCQGGWAAMLLAATNPGATGPIVVAGSPLSYWAGVRGKNPLRYLGGLSGGALPALVLSDLTGGRFDGAHLVHNFESMNPGHNWWQKYYHVYANIDTEAERFLQFERWWSGFYFMNEAEIRWILENLFIGNKLSHGAAVLDDGTAIDLRRIRAPIVVFASFGDNITPPQQALHWIADLYQTTDEIAVQGQVIIYTLHESIGHLGIFVSAGVARKQHREITSVTKTIESLAPGLYEMIIATREGGQHVSFEQRTIADIKALSEGDNDDDKFIPVARLSEWATETYEMTMRPIVQSLVTKEMAEQRIKMHPLRQRRRIFSDQNSMMSGVEKLARQARQAREPVAADNPFLKLEQANAQMIEQGWDLYRDVRDAVQEFTFHAIYGSPWMRFLAQSRPPRPAAQDTAQFPEVVAAVSHAALGGYAEAVIRMLVMMAHARGSVRRSRLERSNAILLAREPFSSMSREERARIIHEQTLIVDFAAEEAQATLPVLLPNAADRQRAIDLILEVAGEIAEMSPPTVHMFERLQSILNVQAEGWVAPDLALAGAAVETAIQAAETAVEAAIETAVEIAAEVSGEVSGAAPVRKPRVIRGGRAG